MQADSKGTPQTQERDSGAVDGEQALKMKQLPSARASIISHLTTEIESKSTNIMNFRTKISFTLFIGPFLLLGSIIVGTKGAVKLSLGGDNAMWAAILAALAFLTLGCLAGQIERQVWQRINEWRRCIVSLQDETEITNRQLQEFLIDSTIVDTVRWMYVLVFGLILLAFGASAYLAASVLGGPVSSSGAS